MDELALAGNASFQSADIPVIRFDLSSDNIDVDAFLGTGSESAPSQASDGEVGASKVQPEIIQVLQMIRKKAKSLI